MITASETRSRTATSGFSADLGRAPREAEIPNAIGRKIDGQEQGQAAVVLEVEQRGRQQARQRELDPHHRVGAYRLAPTRAAWELGSCISRAS